MNRSETVPVVARRKPMRQWLGIEISTYGLGFVFLVTTAWKRGNASDAVTFIVWALAVTFLALIAIGIYRKHVRSRRL
jgi:energy-converting hydrogenase Eha subunit E